MAHPVRSGGRVRSPQPRHDRGHEEGPGRQHHHPEPAGGRRKNRLGPHLGRQARRLHHLHRQYPGRHHLGAVRRRQTAVSVEGVLLDRTDLGGPVHLGGGSQDALQEPEGPAAGQGGPDDGYWSQHHRLGPRPPDRHAHEVQSQVHPGLPRCSGFEHGRRQRRRPWPRHGPGLPGPDGIHKRWQ